MVASASLTLEFGAAELSRSPFGVRMEFRPAELPPVALRASASLTLEFGAAERSEVDGGMYEDALADRAFAQVAGFPYPRSTTADTDTSLEFAYCELPR